MKKNVKNLPEFKALIERYKTVTLEEIAKVFKRHERKSLKLSKITGFGYQNTCTLCRACDGEGYYINCLLCVYGHSYGCTDDETYINIESAKTSEELLAAYRARAAYMETLLK